MGIFLVGISAQRLRKRQTPQIGAPTPAPAMGSAPVIIFQLLLVSSLAAAGDITATSPPSGVDLVTALKIFQVGFQRMMPCGYAPLQLPILAPFALHSYPLNISNDHFRLNSQISNLLINGLNRFRVVDLSFDSTSNHATYDLFMPEVQIVGCATLDLWANWFGLPLAISGGGYMRLDWRVIGVRVSGSFSLGPAPTTSLHVTDLRCTYSLADVVANNWNNSWHKDFNNFINRLLRSYVVMGAQQMRPYVESMYAPIILPHINRMLENVTMTGLIDLLVGVGFELVRNADC